ncbi:hypothetical protein ACIQMO_16945 [Streptomyces sp. NPDC091406]|uniref:hypothetical protein n=1 Tax=unclassified Streptomyces TaxID=2593676 RepID=UPI0037FDEAA3
MATPAPAQPLGEPFSEALAEAAQAAAMSVRLILTIADAVRRAAQKHHQGQEKELGPDAEKLAEGWSAEQLRTVLPENTLHDLMAGADWPLMARHLASLLQAGVDLTTFLPNLGSMASGVEQAVARNTACIRAEGTDRWADLLRRTMPEGLVRDAILAPRPGPTSPPRWATSTTRASTSPGSSPTPTQPASASTRPPPPPGPPPEPKPPPPRRPPQLRHPSPPYGPRPRRLRMRSPIRGPPGPSRR